MSQADEERAGADVAARPRGSTTVSTHITEARRRASTAVSAYNNDAVGQSPDSDDDLVPADGSEALSGAQKCWAATWLMVRQIFFFKSNPAPSQNVKSVRLFVFVFFGVCIGLLLRLGVDSAGKQKTDVGHVFYRLFAFPGIVFVRFLKMLVIPLIFSSIVTGVANFADLATKGPAGRFCLAYIGIGTLLASVFGCLWALLLRPGVYIQDSTPPTQSGDSFMSTFNGIMDLFESFVPKNVLEDVAKSRPNVIGLLFFSGLLGGSLVGLGERGKPLLEIIAIFGNAVIRMWPQWLTPVGIFSIVVKSVSSAPDLGETVGRMMTYFAVDIAAQILLGLFLLPMAYLLIARKNPYKYLMGMSQALVTAFGIASSAATMPYTMHCCEVVNKVPAELVNFFVPLGTTLNMFGSATHKGVAIYYMSVMGDPATPGTEYTWNFSQFLICVLLIWLITAGSAAIPSGSLATMPPIMAAMGMSGDRIEHVTPIDWMLDRFRTTVNVLGTAYGVGMLQAYLEFFERRRARKKSDDKSAPLADSVAAEDVELNEVYTQAN